jgi:dihydropteroate synthase
MDEVLSFLSDHAAKAERAGLKREQIILDPGIGFGKLPAHSIRVLSQLERLVALGYPTLIGTSRKSFIGHITGQPVEKRVFGTAASLALAIAAGIDIVRVHDVAAARDVVQVSDAIVRVS